jgi:protein phosphatase
MQARVPSGQNRAPLQLTGAMLTDVGRVRAANEDNVAYVLPAPGDPRFALGALAVVADGMGGHAAGRLASLLAVNAVVGAFYEIEGPVHDRLARAFDEAEAAIRRHAAENPEHAGMGTTCTAIALHDNRIWLAHVGDSRAYILRDGVLSRLSQDHTLVAKLLRDGAITEEEAKTHPQRNVILQCLGANREPAADIWAEGLAAREGDSLVLCSDGLHGLVEDERIRDVVLERSPHDASAALVALARDAGGYDNISVGVFRLGARDGDGTRPHTDTRPIKIPASLL